MMGSMGSVGSAPRAAASDEISILGALARLVDPQVGPEISRIAASMPREDVRRAIEGLHECLALVSALTPLEPAVAEAIEDLQRRNPSDRPSSQDGPSWPRSNSMFSSACVPGCRVRGQARAPE